MILKKINALNNLRKKETSLTPREGELLAESLGCFPYLYDETFKGLQEKDVVENAKLLKN